MELQGLKIEAAAAPGYRKPAPVKGGLLQSKLRPDVMAREGCRAVFGVAMTMVEASKKDMRDELEIIASKCRKVVICVSEDAADQAVACLLQDADKQHLRKVHLLRPPQNTWQEMPKPPRTPGRRAFNRVVTVISTA